MLAYVTTEDEEGWLWWQCLEEEPNILTYIHPTEDVLQQIDEWCQNLWGASSQRLCHVYAHTPCVCLCVLTFLTFFLTSLQAPPSSFWMLSLPLFSRPSPTQGWPPALWQTNCPSVSFISIISCVPPHLSPPTPLFSAFTCMCLCDLVACCVTHYQWVCCSFSPLTRFYVSPRRAVTPRSH